MTGAVPVIAITPGEPAGVGPELCMQFAAAMRTGAAHFVLIGDADLLAARAAALGAGPTLARLAPGQRPLVAGLSVWHHPLAQPSRPGRLDPANARCVLATLESAVDGCVSGRFDALVTGPVHKGVINDAGIPFTGHTEFLAARTGTARVVMMLVGGGLRVALATTHLPLRAVADAITPGGLDGTLRILHHDLRARFGILQPRILVAGLNPHAGESGHMGREEIDVMAPVLNQLRSEGMLLDGPLPADTLFTPRHLDEADAVLAMYHDQGLPVLKMKSFGLGVNVTLGLPIVRTSVDHGTALDLAGTGRADGGSLAAAVALAVELVSPR